MPGNIIVIGATSGMGRALAVEMHKRGYIVGASGRRKSRLETLKEELGDRIFVQQMDITQFDDAIEQLEKMAARMEGIDIIVLNAGVSTTKNTDDRENDMRVAEVNIMGFVNLAAYCFARFEEQGRGHLVGVSSISSLFGWGLSVPYNASKAFVNRYLQGYRQKANHSEADITVTNLMPGYVETEMTEGKKGIFWVASAPKAARQMARAIERRVDHAYITKRWRVIAWLIKLTPQWFWNRM